MTHPLTPREKDLAIETDPKLSSTGVDDSTIASGSGDHAELARLAEAATPGPWGYCYDGSSDWSVGRLNDPQLEPPYMNIWDKDDARANANAAFIAAANPATVLALLAQIAALRAQHEADMAEVVRAGQNLQSQRIALTEAERKLAEAVGLLTGMCVGTSTVKVRAVREWLSKEAERG